MGGAGDTDVEEVAGGVLVREGLGVGVEEDDVIEFEAFGLSNVGDVDAGGELKILVIHPP